MFLHLRKGPAGENSESSAADSWTHAFHAHDANVKDGVGEWIAFRALKLGNATGIGRARGQMRQRLGQAAGEGTEGCAARWVPL